MYLGSSCYMPSCLGSKQQYLEHFPVNPLPEEFSSPPRIKNFSKYRFAISVNLRNSLFGCLPLSIQVFNLFSFLGHCRVLHHTLYRCSQTPSRCSQTPSRQPPDRVPSALLWEENGRWKQKFYWHSSLRQFEIEIRENRHPTFFYSLLLFCQSNTRRRHKSKSRNCHHLLLWNVSARVQPVQQDGRVENLQQVW